MPYNKYLDWHMLSLEIENISPANATIADYRIVARTNRDILERVTLKNHPRAAGWVALVRRYMAEFHPTT